MCVVYKYYLSSENEKLNLIILLILFINFTMTYIIAHMLRGSGASSQNYIHFSFWYFKSSRYFLRYWTAFMKNFWGRLLHEIRIINRDKVLWLNLSHVWYGVLVNPEITFTLKWWDYLSHIEGEITNPIEYSTIAPNDPLAWK